MLISAQLVLRGWALYPSWFYLDDFQVLNDASSSGLSLDYLTKPYDSQFMPVGRFMAWVIASQGQVNWTAAATLTLGVQLVASIACLWMLVTLFGARWKILVPLSLYLFSAIPLPATMWWAASLNTLPLQICFFTAVASWINYLRSRRLIWLAITTLTLAFGILAYVKALVVLLVLAFMALAWFAEGGIRARVVTVLRRYWPAVLVGAVLGGAFLFYYLTEVPQLTTDSPRGYEWKLANTMLGIALSVGVVGGPWRWSQVNPPAGLADPPAWAIHLAWVVIAFAVAYWFLRRERTGRVWVLFAGCALASYTLLLVTRAPVVGSVAGLEYRYLTDVACALCLCVGLAMMPLLGSTQATALRRDPLLRVQATTAVAVSITALVSLSGVASSVAYAREWHENNPPEVFLKRVQGELKYRGPVDFADTAVPDDVLPGYLYPFNTTSRLLPVVVKNARFPTVTARLAVLDEDGTPRGALIDTSTVSQPGPTPECGWLVADSAVTIPLEATAFDFTWWVRIGYLGSAADTITVQVGDTIVDAPVSKGLHSIFVNVTDEISHVTISGLGEGTRMCVDTVEVGLAVPGGPLE